MLFLLLRHLGVFLVFALGPLAFVLALNASFWAPGIFTSLQIRCLHGAGEQIPTFPPVRLTGLSTPGTFPPQHLGLRSTFDVHAGVACLISAGALRMLSVSRLCTLHRCPAELEGGETWRPGRDIFSPPPCVGARSGTASPCLGQCKSQGLNPAGSSSGPGTGATPTLAQESALGLA